jgi:hypothetical protein
MTVCTQKSLELYNGFLPLPLDCGRGWLLPRSGIQWRYVSPSCTTVVTVKVKVRSKDPITAPGLLLLTMKDFWNTDTNQIIGNFLRINPQVFNIPQQQKISFSLLAVATQNTELQVASILHQSSHTNNSNRLLATRAQLGHVSLSVFVLAYPSNTIV